MAWQWGGVASGHGVAVDGTPRVGDIAWFSSTSGVGSAGHVAYVEAVSGGRVTVSEDNYGGDFDWRQYNISDVTGFIHFGGGVDPGPPDGDGDGTPDASDRCPSQGGPPTTAGCPDADSDGIADLDDVCPQAIGPAGTRGCPPEEYDSSSLSDFNGDGRSDVAAFYDYGGPGGHARGFMFTGSPSGLSNSATQFWDSGAGNWEMPRARLVGGFIPPIPREPGSPPPNPPGVNPGSSGASPTPGQETGSQPNQRAGAVNGLRAKRLNSRWVRISWKAATGADHYRARINNPRKKRTKWVAVNSPHLRIRLRRGQHVVFVVQAVGSGGLGPVTQRRI